MSVKMLPRLHQTHLILVATFFSCMVNGFPAWADHHTLIMITAQAQPGTTEVEREKEPPTATKKAGSQKEIIAPVTPTQKDQAPSDKKRATTEVEREKEPPTATKKAGSQKEIIAPVTPTQKGQPPTVKKKAGARRTAPIDHSTISAGQIIVKGHVVWTSKGKVVVEGTLILSKEPNPRPDDLATGAASSWDRETDSAPPTVVPIDSGGGFGPVMTRTGGFLMVAVDADTSSVPIDNPPVQPSDEDLKREEFTEFVKTVIARWEKELADPNTSKLRRDILESKMQNLKDFVLASPRVRDEEARGIFRLIISQVTWIEIAADLVSSAAELLGYTDVPVPTLGTTLKGLKWVAEVSKWEKTAKAVDKALKATELYEKIENLEEKAKQLEELKDTLENVGNELSALPMSPVELVVSVETTSQFIMGLKSEVVLQDFANSVLRDRPWRLIFTDERAGSILTVGGEMNSLCQHKRVAFCEIDFKRVIEEIVLPTIDAAP